MKTLLITGFDPFSGANVNASWAAVEGLPDTIGDFALCKLQLQTVFGRAPHAVIEKADACHPDAILCVGVAAGRDAVTPERIGVNIRDARIADNAGVQPRGERIVPDAPAAYFSSMDVERMAQAARETGCRAAVSNSAGTFVCNDTLFTLLHHFRDSSVRVGFVHVPQLPTQGSPSMPLERIVAALRAMIPAIE